MDKDLLTNLEKFTGTEKYHQFYNLLLTDGIKYLADNAGCWWLLDIIFSVQHKIREPFIVWRIKVNQENKHWIIEAWSDTPDKSTILYTQRGTFTDFPLPEYEFYQDGNVLLLKSEH